MRLESPVVYDSPSSPKIIQSCYLEAQAGPPPAPVCMENGPNPMLVPSGQQLTGSAPRKSVSTRDLLQVARSESAADKPGFWTLRTLRPTQGSPSF